jgi:hypothetical protein
MTDKEMLPRLVTFMKCYSNLTVSRLCFFTGYPEDSVRRVLRNNPCFIASGPKTLNGRTWSYDPSGEPPKKEKKPPKVSPEKHKQYKANSDARETKRLKEPWINREKVWGL